MKPFLLSVAGGYSLAGISTQLNEIGAEHLCDVLFCFNFRDRDFAELIWRHNGRCNNIQIRFARIRCNSAQLARYVGIEPSRVSRALTLELPFTGAEARDILETIDAMRSVQSETLLPVAWSLIGKVKPHIDSRKNALREQTDPIVRRCILIRISATSFFQRLNGANVVTTPSELNAAAFEIPGLADEVVRELKKLGTAGRTEFFGAFRRKSTMTHGLLEIGIEVEP